MTCGILLFKGIEQSLAYLQKIAELNVLMCKYKTKVYQDGGLQSGNWEGSGLTPQLGGQS